jgi:hypothetical protein
MSRRRRALTAVLVAGALGGALALSSPPVAADPAPCRHLVSTDFDGSGPDVVVGLPSYDLPGKPDAGAIAVFSNVSQGGSQVPDAVRARTLLTADDFDGLTSQAGARFGAAVVVWRDSGSLDDPDDCADLLVGAPGQSVAGEVGAGQVYRLAGRPGGLGRVLDVFDEASLDGTDGAQVGAGFGSAIAAVTRQSIAIGVPGRDLGRVTDAGRVDRIDYGATGVPVSNTVVQQGGLAGGTPEKGDQFGEVLAFTVAQEHGSLSPVPARGLLLAVGVPHEDVGSRVDAGIVTVVSRDEGSSSVSQDSAGAGGAAEAGDQYGAALDVFGTHEHDVALAIGVPGEDLAGAKDAGLVSYASFGPVLDDGAPILPLRGWASTTTQATPGVPGSPEAGDQFGAAVLIGRFGWEAMPPCSSAETDSGCDLVVGSPREDLGSAADAGMVSTIRIKDDGSVRSGPQPGVWSQDSPGVYGVAESQDRFGRGLGWVQLTNDEDSSPLPVLLVTVSREDVGALTDAGMAYIGYPPGTASYVPEAAAVPLMMPEPQAGAGLGMVLMQMG